MGQRRKGREAALQILYQIEMKESDPKETVQLFWKTNPTEQDVKDFTSGLIDGVIRNRLEIDQVLRKHSTHWKLERMAVVDRNILRLGVYELLYLSDVPKSVSLNEAIEIAKKFGTEDSGSFINGILDHVAKEVKK